MRRVGRVAALLLSLLFAVGAAPTAYASCAMDSGPSGSPVIFVGTAEEERRGFTRFSVSEVWAGPDLAPDVWVLSGQRQPAWPWGMFTGVSSSADADFVAGASYVVGANAAFMTNACSVGELRTLTADRPSRPRAPVAGGAVGADPPTGALGQGLWIAGVLAAIAGVIALLRRRSVGRRPGSDVQT